MARDSSFPSLHQQLPNSIGFDLHNQRHYLDVFEHTLAVVDGTPSDLLLRWVALLHDVGKLLCFSHDEFEVGLFYGHDYKSFDMAVRIRERLGYSEELVDRVSSLVYYHMTRIYLHTDRAVRKVSRKLGEDDTERLVLLLNADRRTHAPGDSVEEPVFFEVIYRHLQMDGK